MILFIFFGIIILGDFMDKTFYFKELNSNKRVMLFDSIDIALFNIISPSINFVSKKFIDDKRFLIERVPTALETFYNARKNLYLVKESNIKKLKQLSENTYSGIVDLNKNNYIKIDNVYNKIKELEEEKKLELYNYPERPFFIPKDDNDLIDYSFNTPTKEIKKLKKIKELLLVHPELIYNVNDYLDEKKIDYSFSDSDLVKNYEIYARDYCEKALGGVIKSDDRKGLDLIYLQNCNYFLFNPNVLGLLDYDYKGCTTDKRNMKRLITRVNYKMERDDSYEI